VFSRSGRSGVVSAAGGRGVTALARALPQAQVIRPGSGHIGRVVGRGMRETVWKPLADFLRLN